MSFDIWNLSVVIPTYERPKEIMSLINSLNIDYPDLNLIVIDTSKEINRILKKESNKINLEYIHMLNNGISCSRNIWLEKVNTDLVLFMDDDFKINKEKTKLLSFMEKFQGLNLDILWGEVNNIWSEKYDFHWKYEFLGDTLIHFVWLENKKLYNVWIYDTIFNYFVWKTKKIIENWWWDEELKFAREHDDFFLNIKNKWLCVWYDDTFWINHNDILIKHYNVQDNTSSIKHFCEKWDITSKIEVRIYKEEWKTRLSIYRFMWKKEMQLTDNEKEFILEKLWLEEKEVKIDYNNIC